MTPEQYKRDLLDRIRDDFNLIGRGLLARAGAEPAITRFAQRIDEAFRLRSISRIRAALVEAIRQAYLDLTVAVYGAEIEAGTLALINARMREMQNDSRRYTPTEQAGRLVPLAIAAGMTLLLNATTAATLRPELSGSSTRLEEAQALYRNNAAAHIEALISGEILRSAWADRMRAEIRQLHTRACVIATGGSPDNAALQVLQAQINDQLGYFNRWAAELGAQSIEEWNASKMRARANLYAGASNETFARCITTRLSIPELPFYPAEDTLCRTNCHCAWRVVERGPSDWDCYWTLGEAEHCAVCMARAQVARPLRVRNGRILDPLKYSDPALFA